MMHAGTAAAATAGAGGATGLWLFGYNKDNFGFDAGMRFGRFMMSRGFANAQVGQYRQDIEGITGMTVSKMDAWQTVSTLFLAVSAALSCAGRIGMHGCAPPGWFCALFSGNIFLAVLFNAVSLWLSMHASLRAQCAATSLLTRKVRLPIPSLAQLDQARVFGSTFEKQETRDIFRVPFMRHPHAAPDMPVAQPEPEELAKMSRQEKARKAAHDPQLDFLTTNRDTIPSWLRDELVVDKGEGFPSGHAEPLHEDREAPEHFKLLMKAQEEWRDYDVYARISMLYGVVSFLYAVTYYTIGTAISELRGFWIMWSIPLVTMTAQALILRLDIMRTGRHYLPHWELIGSLAPYIAVAAASLEYRFYYSSYQVAITWVLVYLCFFCHLAMALRMLDLAWPDEAKSEDMPEEPGRQWWPRTWKVPAGFTKNLWFITPPKKLEASQHDLMHEMQDMRAHGGGVTTCRRRHGPQTRQKTGAEMKEEEIAGAFTGPSPFRNFSALRAENLPWNIMRVAILTAVTCWVFMMVVTAVEIVLGPETLLKPPGEPPWIRDTKARNWTETMIHTSSKNLPTDYRLFSAADARYDSESSEGHGESHHRRLDGADAAVDDLLKTLPMIAEMVDAWQDMQASMQAMPEAAAVPAALNFMAPNPNVVDVEWPILFEPRHLLCGHHSESKVLALTRRGFGAMIDVSETNDAPAPQTFGLTNLGASALAGASWNPDGLDLVTTTGDFLTCLGHAPKAGIWACKAADHYPRFTLPAGVELLSAALSGGSIHEVKLGVIMKHMPSVVMTFRIEGGNWRSDGEVHVPLNTQQAVLQFDGHDILISTAKGEVHRRAPGGPSTSHTVSTVGPESREFVGACSPRPGSLLHLTLKQESSETGAWRPELVTSS